ncbi:hypothetical protein ACTXT7_005312 [Hymenolepis weldensis]
MQSISTNTKRVMKQSQRPRKKPLPHHSKMSSQVIESGDKGSNYNPLGSYTLGNVAEVHTSTYVSIGVVKAISPLGDVGLMSVRTAPIGEEDGRYTIEKYKCIPLSEIKHVIARDIKPVGVLKDNVPAEDSCHLNDSDNELQKFYESPGEGDACSLNSEEGFPADQMFKINREKYNVVSTFKDNLEGYTCPLDKSDPDFKKKEQYYAKVAKEIEDDKSLASNWEAMAEGDIESEEVKFSAVMKEGVQGRELKTTYNRNNRNNKGSRGNARASLPRETTEANKSSVRPNAFTLPREQSKSVAETVLSKSEKPTPKASRVTTPAIVETPEKLESKEKGESKSPSSKLDFDPDAPIFEPSHTVPTESVGDSLVTSAVTGPAQPQGVVSNPAVAQPQQPLPNGVSSTLSFSALPYPNPGLLSFPFRPSANMNPQQMTFMNQYSFMNAGTQSQRGIRPNVPGGYTKQRPLDQTNSVPLSVPFPGFGYPSYTLGVPFMAAGNVPLSHPSLPMTGSIPVAPTVQQSTSAPPLAAAAGQASQTVQSPPPVHAGTTQFQALFNPTQNPASYGTQYPTAAGGQPVGYYPQSLAGYQAAAGLMYHPGHPQAHGHAGQQPLIPQPLQLQPNAAAATPQQQGAAAAAAYNHYQAAAVAAIAAAISQQQQQQQQNAPPTAAFMHPQQLQQLQYLAQQQQTNNPG